MSSMSFVARVSRAEVETQPDEGVPDILVRAAKSRDPFDVKSAMRVVFRPDVVPGADNLLTSAETVVAREFTVSNPDFSKGKIPIVDVVAHFEIPMRDGVSPEFVRQWEERTKHFLVNGVRVIFELDRLIGDMETLYDAGSSFVPAELAEQV